LKHTIPDTTQNLYLYTAAAILVTAIVPFTIGVMKPTNDKLFRKADVYSGSSVAGKEDPEMDQLLKKWATLNAIRSLFPGVASVLGLWAVIS